MTVNFADLPAETLLKVCDFLSGDGHSIWKTEPLLELLPKEYVESVTHTYESDGTHKGSIYAPGSPGMPGTPVLAKSTGVYGLSLYRRIGIDLGVPRPVTSGRGFQAREWDRNIREHLKQDQDVDYGAHANGHSPTTYTGNA